MELGRLVLQGPHIEEAGIRDNRKDSQTNQRHQPSLHKRNDESTKESAANLQHDGYFLPYCSLESLRVGSEGAAELRLIDAVKPPNLLLEEGGEVGLAADGGLALSADEPAGDHQPPREQRADAQVDELLQSLPSHLHDHVRRLPKNIREVAPEKDEEGSGSSQTKRSESTQEHE